MDQIYVKGLTVRQVIEILSKLDKKGKVYLSQDEEFNAIYKGIGVSIEKDTGEVVLFPLSGTEIESE
jgi:predicted glycosyltransferase